MGFIKNENCVTYELSPKTSDWTAGSAIQKFDITMKGLIVPT